MHVQQSYLSMSFLCQLWISLSIYSISLSNHQFMDLTFSQHLEHVADIAAMLSDCSEAERKHTLSASALNTVFLFVRNCLEVISSMSQELGPKAGTQVSTIAFNQGHPFGCTRTIPSLNSPSLYFFPSHYCWKTGLLMK